MVRLVVVLPASPPRARRLQVALRSLMGAVRLEEGCLGCSVWLDPDSTVHYVEEWANEPDAERRVRSERFTSLLSVIEASEQPPDVRFDFVMSTRGLDYVAELRGNPREAGGDVR